MKIALYIEDGLEQIVLTPQSDTEKGILAKMHGGLRSFEIRRGAFYECRGGWVRNGPLAADYRAADDSTMIVLRARETAPE